MTRVCPGASDIPNEEAMRRTLFSVVLTLAALVAKPGAAQLQYDPGAMIAEQREAMAALSAMDGVWRGPASTLSPSGEWMTLTQTERVGPFLNGTVRVIEGRGFATDGSVTFNALGVVSYNSNTDAYEFRTYAMGQSGTYAFVVTDDGYAWEIPVGPMTIKYVATISDGTWREVGHRLSAAGESVKFFEMTLERVADTDWPAANPVTMTGQ